MSYIQLPGPDDVKGEVKEVFDDTVNRWGYMPNISRAYCLAPEVMKAEDVWSKGVMYKGFLPRSLKEAIATAVSATNTCNYCASSHAHAYTIAGGDAEHGKACKLLDFSGFEEKERVVLEFTQKATRDAKSIKKEDIEKLQQFYSDGEIVEISAVIQQFMGYNWFVTILGLEIEDSNPMRSV
jgi:uncharacterized peroxidase-related enzyme